MSAEPGATQGWYCEGEATGAQVTPCSPSNPIHDAPCGPIPPNEDIAEVLRRLNVARATVPAGGPTDRVLRQAHELISALRASSGYGVLWGDEDPIDEDDPEGPCESPTVQTWKHEIKGVITGVEVGGDDTWMMVRVVGDHRLRWLSPGRTQGGGEVTHDGEVGTYRRSRMVPVAESDILEPSRSTETDDDRLWPGGPFLRPRRKDGSPPRPAPVSATPVEMVCELLAPGQTACPLNNLQCRAPKCKVPASS